MDFRRGIEQVVADRQHGSSWLVARICSLLASRQGLPDDKAQLHWAWSRLADIDGSMAVVHHFLNTLAPAITGDFYGALQRYQQRWNDIHLPISRHLCARWSFSDAPLLLHSHSGLVLKVAEQLSQARGQLAVLQTRSMPGGEGALQAQQLAEVGVRVTLIEDEAVRDRAPLCQAALLGVDQYCDDGFVNKRGSGEIVQVMADLGKPVFLLADSRKRVSSLCYSPTLFEAVPFAANVQLITEQPNNGGAIT